MANRSKCRLVFTVMGIALSLLECRSQADPQQRIEVSEAQSLSAASPSGSPPAGPSSVASPAAAATKGSPPEPVSCHAPFPTLGQRWRERLTASSVFPPDAGPGSFRGQTRTEKEEVFVEVRALDGGTPIRVTRTILVNGWQSEDIDDRTLDAQHRFWVGKGSWAAVVPRGPGAEGFSRAKLNAMGAALSHRLGVVIGDPSRGRSHVRLEPPSAAKLTWGNALVFRVQARGKTGSIAAGQWISEDLALAGELTLRSEDAALVSLVLQGHATLTEQWPALNTKYPPIRGSRTIRFESSCFATELRAP